MKWNVPYKDSKAQEDVLEVLSHKTLLNSLDTFHGTEYLTRTIPRQLQDSLFMGSTQAMYCGGFDKQL